MAAISLVAFCRAWQQGQDTPVLLHWSLTVRASKSTVQPWAVLAFRLTTAASLQQRVDASKARTSPHPSNLEADHSPFPKYKGSHSHIPQTYGHLSHFLSFATLAPAYNSNPPQRSNARPPVVERTTTSPTPLSPAALFLVIIIIISENGVKQLAVRRRWRRVRR